MFTIDQSFTHLVARPEQVLAVVHSLNALSVKVADLPTNPAMGYFVAWDLGRGQAAALIYLNYTEIAGGVAYLHEPRAFVLTELPQVTEEAWNFLESMGFMLDDASYGTLRPEEQVALLERLPLFQQLSKGASVEASAATSPTPHAAKPSDRAQAVGRLLMSF